MTPELAAERAALAPAPSGVATLRPGDTLLLTFAQSLSEEEVDQIKTELRSTVDKSVKIAVVDGVAGCVVYRPA